MYAVALSSANKNRTLCHSIKGELPSMYDFKDPGDLPDTGYEYFKPFSAQLKDAARHRERPWEWTDQRVAWEWLIYKVRPLERERERERERVLIRLASC